MRRVGSRYVEHGIIAGRLDIQPPSSSDVILNLWLFYSSKLFGDTVNTASRMESTGQKNRIQVSQDTADLIRASGKGRWLQQREGLVAAKGKGEVTTYWVNLGSTSVNDMPTPISSSGEPFANTTPNAESEKNDSETSFQDDSGALYDLNAFASGV